MQLSPYILAGWLLDGSAGPVQRKIFLEIKNGRIAVIRRATEKDLAAGDLLDLSDCTLLAGLEDRAGRLVPGSPATFLAVRAEPERLLESLGSPERVYLKGIPIPPMHLEWRRES
jgi:hypothetical protein